MTGNFYLGGRYMPRADFMARAHRIASLLVAEGVGVDDAVGVLLRNDVLYLEIVEACRYVGATYVTLNWHAATDETAHIIADSGARVVIAHSDLVAHVTPDAFAGAKIIAAATPPEIIAAYGLSAPTSTPHADLDGLIANLAPTAAAPLKFRGMFAYTSGSTGRPKGIRRRLPDDMPDMYDVYAGYAKNMMQAGPGDRFYVAAPLYHSAPNGLSMFCVADGTIDVYIEPKFDAERFLADIERFKITHAYIVPTMMVRLLKLPKTVRERYDVSSLRYSISTGSPFPVEVKNAMIAWFGPIFHESYGASEIGFMTLISSTEAQEKPGSVGRVLPGGSIKIMDDDGCELPAGETGLIYVTLPTFRGFDYTNADPAALTAMIDGHATVGDVGHLDSEGYLYISDRKKDMIISGGANIFPAEIEAALIEMPQVLDCAVFGAPHLEFGETIVAAVQTRDDMPLSLAEVTAFLAPRLARFKLPKKLDLHTALPREDSGKIFKQKLRAPYWADSDRAI